MREMICICCPMGCRLTVDDSDLQNIQVSGNTCKRGEQYAKDEVTAPKRMITSIVPVAGGTHATVPVKTSQPVPKEKIFQALACLKGLHLRAPIAEGQVIVSDVLGTGADFIATKRVDASAKKFILALDQGTTSSRAIVFDECGAIVASAQREFPQIYPCPGWVEHDPEQIWQTQSDVMRQAVARAGLHMRDIVAIGITNQRETTVVWDKATGKPVHNAIVWQCRRTADVCEAIKKQGKESMVYAKTGLPIDAYFSATKIAWILDHVKGARAQAKKGNLLFGTIDTFLIWRLTGGRAHVTDYTNASRTMLYDIHNLRWDDELCKLFGVEPSMLPEVLPSQGLFGYTDEATFGARVPILGVAGDQQAALFGHLCVHKGEGKNTYGTGCFTLMNTGDTAVTSHRGLITTLAASAQEGRPQYVLEGSVFVGGAVLQWLRDEVHMISKAREADEIAERTPDTGGVYVVPAFVGLGAPHWDSQARGTITGITRGTRREHIVRAALESIAYQVFDVVHAMENDLGSNLTCLNVDGGASVSDVLMQFQSDLLGCAVERPRVVETTALGVCYLAGLEAGVWKDADAIRATIASGKRFEPVMDADTRDRLLMGWEESIARTRRR